jgi:hypothetical protein
MYKCITVLTQYMDFELYLRCNWQDILACKVRAGIIYGWAPEVNVRIGWLAALRAEPPSDSTINSQGSDSNANVSVKAITT